MDRTIDPSDGTSVEAVGAAPVQAGEWRVHAAGPRYKSFTPWLRFILDDAIEDQGLTVEHPGVRHGLVVSLPRLEQRSIRHRWFGACNDIQVGSRVVLSAINDDQCIAIQLIEPGARPVACACDPAWG